MTTHSQTWMTLREQHGRGGLAAVAVAVARMLARRRQRADLAELSPRLLRDIGVTPEEALREAQKPAWQR